VTVRSQDRAAEIRRFSDLTIAFYRNDLASAPDQAYPHDACVTIEEDDMAHRLVIAVGMIAAASPLSATVQDQSQTTGAPAGNPETRYCMHIEAVTGSRIEKLKCWTRDEWAQHDVDLDRDWPKEGVRTIG